jgi:hypothetical protein
VNREKPPSVYEAARLIKLSLESRSDREWTVLAETPDSLRIVAPMLRRNKNGMMSPQDIDELSSLLGVGSTKYGIRIMDKGNRIIEFIERARGVWR